MRSAREQEWFPYDSKTTCYILVDKSGNVTQVSHIMRELQEAYNAVLEDRAVLYAVWPGRWSSDLFVVDDLNAFADAVGIQREDEHIHDLEWEISRIDDGSSRYAWVECKFNCGCSLMKMGIKKFANDMLKQKGWNVATSKGYGGHGNVYTVSVNRSSLDRK